MSALDAESVQFVEVQFTLRYPDVWGASIGVELSTIKEKFSQCVFPTASIQSSVLEIGWVEFWIEGILRGLRETVPFVLDILVESSIPVNDMTPERESEQERMSGLVLEVKKIL